MERVYITNFKEAEQMDGERKRQDQKQDCNCDLNIIATLSYNTTPSILTEICQTLHLIIELASLLYPIIHFCTYCFQ